MSDPNGDAGAPDTPAQDSKRSLDDLSKEELLRFIRKLRDSHSSLKNELIESNERGVKFHEQAEDYKKKLVDLIPKCKAFQQKIKDLEEECISKTNSLESLKIQCDELADSVATLKSTPTPANPEVERYKSLLDKAVPKIKELQSRCHSLEQELSDSKRLQQQQPTSTSTSPQQAKPPLESPALSPEPLLNLVALGEREAAELRYSLLLEQYNRTEQDLQNRTKYEVDITALSEEFSLLKGLLSAADENTSSLESQIFSLEARLREAEELCGSESAQLVEQEEVINGLDAELQAALASVEAAKEREMVLKEEMEKNKEMLEEARSVLVMVQSGQLAQNDAVECTASEISSLQASLEHLTGEHSMCIASVQALTEQGGIAALELVDTTEALQVCIEQLASKTLAENSLRNELVAAVQNIKEGEEELAAAKEKIDLLMRDIRNSKEAELNASSDKLQESDLFRSILFELEAKLAVSITDANHLRIELDSLLSTLAAERSLNELLQEQLATTRSDTETALMVKISQLVETDLRFERLQSALIEANMSKDVLKADLESRCSDLEAALVRASPSPPNTPRMGDIYTSNGSFDDGNPMHIVVPVEENAALLFEKEKEAMQSMLDAEREVVRGEVESMRKMLMSAEESKDTLQQHLKIFEQELEKSKYERSEYLERIKSLEKMLDAEREVVRGEVESMRKMLMSAEESKDTLQQQLKISEQELDRSKSECSKLEDMVENSLKEKMETAVQMDAREQIVETLTSERESTILEKSVLASELEELRCVNSKLTASLDAATSSLAAASEDKEKVQAMLAKAMEKLKESTLSFRDEKALLETTIGSLQADIERVATACNAQQDSEEATARREKRINELESTVRRLEESSAVYVLRADDNEMTMKEKDKTNHNLQMNIASLTSDASAMRNDLECIVSECSVFEAFTQRLETRLFPSLPSHIPGEEETGGLAVASLTRATDRIYREIDRVLSDIDCRNSSPDSFAVAVVCEHSGTQWCLTDCIRGRADCHGLEWHPIHLVHQWLEEREEADLPVVSLPSSLQEMFTQQVDLFRSQIATLESELSGSKQVFDTYRERARVSLQKTASEQQEVEKLLGKAKEECKAQARRADDAMENLCVVETKHELIMEDLRSKLETEQGCSQELRQMLAEIKADLERAHQSGSELDRALKSGSEITSRRSEEIFRIEEELKATKRQVVDLEDMIENLKRKEQKLVAEQKKRSESARQLVEAKDKEIARLSDHQALLGTHSPPVGGRSSFTGPDAGSPCNLTAAMHSEQELVELKQRVVELSSLNDHLLASQASMEERVAGLTFENNSLRGRVVSPDHLTPPSSGSVPKDMETPLSKYAASLTSECSLINRVHQNDGSPIHPGHPTREDELIEHVTYLRQAFCRFVRTRDPVEMQHCGRVMCAILSLQGTDQGDAMANIERISQGIAPTSLEVVASSIFSFYS